MDQAVGELTRQILHNFLGIAALLQRGQRLRRQLLTDLLRLRTVLTNGLAGALRAQPGHKFAGLLLDDRFRLHRRGLTLRQVMLNDVLQIVDAVEVSVSQFADLRFDVARDGDIHQQHRLVTPRLERALHHAFADDRQRTSGGADNDVGLFQPFVDIAKGNHLGAHFFR